MRKKEDKVYCKKCDKQQKFETKFNGGDPVKICAMCRTIVEFVYK